MSFGAGGSRTGLSAQPGTVSSSQSYNASMGYSDISRRQRRLLHLQRTGPANRRWPCDRPHPHASPSLKSGGPLRRTRLLRHLAPATIKRLILSASYSNSNSNTTYDEITSSNNTNEFNAFAQSQFRKLYFNSGYSRLEQGFSASGTAPEIISTFYVGISRWFNVF